MTGIAQKSKGCAVDCAGTLGYLSAANALHHNFKILSIRGNPLHSAIVDASDRNRPPPASSRRFVLVLAGFTALPSILLAAFVLVVDPYYVFGSPSLPGINTVRPLYELHVIAAQPYQ